MELPAFGVVCFDNVERPEFGWASLAGDKLLRIRCIGDLQSDAIWITNLTYEQMTNYSAWKNSKLKRISFFREDIYRLSKELGLEVGSNNNAYIRVLSEVVNRIMLLAHANYKFDRIGSSLKETVNESLMTPILDMDNNGSGSLLIDNYLEEAFHVYQMCYGHFPSENYSVNLKFPRAGYAKEMLGVPVPFGRWSQVKSFPKKDGAAKRVEGDVFKFLTTAEGEQTPFLCNVSVSNLNYNIAELLDISNGTLRRNWLTSHEAALLACHGDVELKEVFKAECYQFLNERIDLVQPEMGVVGELSYSMGILSENHWLALASETKIDRHGATKKLKSSRAVWMRSWDRIFCFKASMALKNAGFLIRGYGVGSVDVSVVPERIPALIDIAESIGLSSPLWLHNEKRDIESLANAGGVDDECQLKFVG